MSNTSIVYDDTRRVSMMLDMPCRYRCLGKWYWTHIVAIAYFSFDRAIPHGIMPKEP
jgi:hypothetical protein